MSSLWASDFKVGDWWARRQLNLLERGEEAERVEPRSMDVLACLARRGNEVVSKEEIHREVWRGDFVGDEAISHAIWDLRRALGDDARSPAYIQTVPRRGYRLLVETARSEGLPLAGVDGRVDHFDLFEELGRGAMGVVYRARDRSLERTVAVKFLAPELTRDHTARRRFEREATLAASLDHPHLTAVYGIGETRGGQRYIVSPFYAGGSLEQRLDRGSLPWREAVELVARLARGLAEAHRLGIIHRDVKPANILRTETGEPKLVDFGIAKLEGSTRLTAEGTPLGTPAYRSPEQTRGDPVDHRTDIWSLGVVLYEALTGRRPFRGDYSEAVIYSILKEEPEELELEDVPRGLWRLLHEILSKDPEARPQDADRVADALEGFLREPSDASSGRGRGRLATAGTLLVVAVGFGAYELGRHRGPPSTVGLSSAVGSPSPLREEASRRIREAEGHLAGGEDVHALDRGIELYRQALELDPVYGEAVAGLAYALVLRSTEGTTSERRDRREEARRLAERASRLDGGEGLARLALARLELLADRPEPAEAHARRAAELLPTDDRAVTLVGEALVEQGLVEEGIAELRRATEASYDQPARARCVLARRLWGLGEIDEAKVQYGAVLDEVPTHTTALANLGILHLLGNRFSEAVTTLKQIPEERRDSRIEINLGTAYFYVAYFQRTGDWASALRAFHRADELSPRSPTAATGLADTYRAQGDGDEARRWYERGLERYNRLLDPASERWSRIAGQRAVCLAKLERFDEARQAIAEVLERYPKDAAALEYAARIHALAGDRSALFPVARRARRAGVTPDQLRIDISFWSFQEDREYARLLEAE